MSEYCVEYDIVYDSDIFDCNYSRKIKSNFVYVDLYSPSEAIRDAERRIRRQLNFDLIKGKAIVRLVTKTDNPLREYYDW